MVRERVITNIEKGVGASLTSAPLNNSSPRLHAGGVRERTTSPGDAHPDCCCTPAVISDQGRTDGLQDPLRAYLSGDRQLAWIVMILTAPAPESPGRW
jgi:hypothetical protein